ncbi:MAG: FAD binding domain-containing protein, partial [Anaerolineaceae bacterium]|nr:FAD binding domain-containing protein [Anaerolineaceae bacterium]
MWKHYYTVSSIEDALVILDGEREKSKIIAGGTDLILEMKKGMHPRIETLVDITRIMGQDKIWIDKNDYINIGSSVTHNQCLVSEELHKYGFPLVRAANSVGTPQIRNVGTIVGNLVTASPANDTITPLVALDAEVIIRSVEKSYSIKLSKFYTGVRRTTLAPNEMVVGIRFPKMTPYQKGEFEKYLLRETHAISVANVCAILTFDDAKIISAKITLGSVAPTIIRARKTEDFLINKVLSEKNIITASALTKEEASPITDIRSSEKYRRYILPVLLKKALFSLKEDTWNSFKTQPVLLWGKKKKFFTPINKTIKHDADTPIKTIINNKIREFKHGQNETLLSLVRNQANLTGTKSGCSEGECGSCTL